MARLAFSVSAGADLKAILIGIAEGSGIGAADGYRRDFLAIFDRLGLHPESCALRPELGRLIRIGVVYPYLVIHAFEAAHGVVRVLRVVHGRRAVTRRLLRGTGQGF